MIPFLYGAKVPKQTAPNLSHFSSCCKRLHATSQTTSVPNLFTHFSCCFSNFPFRRFIVFNIILLDGPSKFFWNIVLDVQIVNRLYIPYVIVRVWKHPLTYSCSFYLSGCSFDWSHPLVIRIAFIVVLRCCLYWPCLITASRILKHCKLWQYDRKLWQ